MCSTCFEKPANVTIKLLAENGACDSTLYVIWQQSLLSSRLEDVYKHFPPPFSTAVSNLMYCRFILAYVPKQLKWSTKTQRCGTWAWKETMYIPLSGSASLLSSPVVYPETWRLKHRLFGSGSLWVSSPDVALWPFPLPKESSSSSYRLRLLPYLQFYSTLNLGSDCLSILHKNFFC